jgi:hypothetical protein
MNTSEKNYGENRPEFFSKLILSRTRPKENANMWWEKENVFLGTQIW